MQLANLHYVIDHSFVTIHPSPSKTKTSAFLCPGTYIIRILYPMLTVQGPETHLDPTLVGN